MLGLLRQVERRQLHPTIEQLLAAGELHERVCDNGHGTGLFRGPAPVAYSAGEEIDAPRLRALLARAGLRQKDLAQLIGAGVARINAWAQGTKSIPAHRQAQLRDLFAVLPQAPEMISGEQLRAERRRLGWTQAQFAARAGVTQAVVSRVGA